MVPRPARGKPFQPARRRRKRVLPETCSATCRNAEKSKAKLAKAEARFLAARELIATRLGETGISESWRGFVARVNANRPPKAPPVMRATGTDQRAMQSLLADKTLAKVKDRLFPTKWMRS